MPSRAISRPIAWKTHAKISIPTRSACNQIKQDQRLDLAIPITLHGSLDTCVSAPRLSLSLAFSLSLWLSLSLSLALSLSLSNRAERMTRTKADGERERERGEEDWRKGEREREREREKHTNVRTPWSCTLLYPYLSIYARNGAQSVYSGRYGNDYGFECVCTPPSPSTMSTSYQSSRRFGCARQLVYNWWVYR